MTPDNQAPARPSEGLQVCPQCRVSPIEVTPGGIVFCDTCKLSVANRAAWIEMHRIAEGPRQAPSPGMLSAESIASYRALNTPRAPDPRPAAGDQERLAELRKTVATILDFVWTEKQMQQLLALIADQVHQAEAARENALNSRARLVASMIDLATLWGQPYLPHMHAASRELLAALCAHRDAEQPARIADMEPELLASRKLRAALGMKPWSADEETALMGAERLRLMTVERPGEATQPGHRSEHCPQFTDGRHFFGERFEADRSRWCPCGAALGDDGSITPGERAR